METCTDERSGPSRHATDLKMRPATPRLAGYRGAYDKRRKGRLDELLRVDKGIPDGQSQ